MNVGMIAAVIWMVLVSFGPPLMTLTVGWGGE